MKYISKLLGYLFVLASFLIFQSAVWAAPIRLMPLGDSITHGFNAPGGYRTAVYNTIGNSDFVGTLNDGPAELADKDHEGHGGWTIGDIQNQVVSWLNTYNPQEVLLLIGTNDINGNIDVNNAPSRLSTLIDTITATVPNAQILVGSIPPFTDVNKNQQANTYNAAIPGIVNQKVAAGKKVTFVNINAGMTTADLADGIHPTAGGYTKIANKWIAALQTIRATYLPEPSPTPGNGFQGDYYNNVTLSGSPTLTRTDSTINFEWAGGSPGAGIPNDNFSARWTRVVTFNAGTYEFSVTSDDGFRLKIDGNTVLDRWIDQGPTTYTVAQNLTAGDHTVVLEYYEKSGGATAKMNWTEITPTPTLPPGNSFSGEYYSNPTLSGSPALTRNDATINFDWVAGSPDPSLPNDNFSVRWTRTLAFEAGSYRFSTTTDDGVRLKIDGNTVINRWVDQGPTTYTHDATLTADNHTIVMEYYEKGGGATAKLSWTQLNTPTPTPTNAPTPTPTTTPAPGDSYQGQYFTNTTLSGSPALTRNDATINFDWVAGSPDPSLPNDNFSVRWTRTLAFEAGSYRFSTTSDDGVRLKVDGSTIIDRWIDQGPTTYTADVDLTAANHTVVMEYYEKSGGATAKMSWIKLTQQPPTDTPTPTPTNNPPPTGAEFSGNYFANPTLSGNPALTRNDATINFDWIGGSPDPSIPNDDFSVRWKRTVTFTAGNYRFSTTTDDGVRLKIDGNTIIDKWVDQGPTTYTADSNLTAGDHVIVMEYYEKSGGATAKMSWSEVAVPPPPPPPGEGFLGEYYNNVSFNGSPSLTRTDAAINFDWGAGSPDPTIPVDNFSVRWTRTIAFNAATYRFTVTSDDGFRLKIDGTIVLERFFNQAPTTYTVDQALTQGNHVVVLEYYEANGGATAIMNWNSL